jgi:hypothetical protein
LPRGWYAVFAIFYFFFKTAAKTSLVVAYLVMIMLCFFIMLIIGLFVTNAMHNWCGFNTNRRQQIEDIFLAATQSEDRDELNYIIKSVNLAFMLSEATVSTIDILSSPAALAVLSTVSKAIIIDALQKRGASTVQHNIVEIFLSCRYAFYRSARPTHVICMLRFLSGSD